MSGCTSTVTSPAPTISVSLSSTDTRTAEIYTLSLHDALPISRGEDADALLGHRAAVRRAVGGGAAEQRRVVGVVPRDRKSTRLNSSHANISYAVFCLKKKKVQHHDQPQPDGYHQHPDVDHVLS